MKKTILFGLFPVAILAALFIFGFSDRENHRSMVPLPPELNKLPTIIAFKPGTDEVYIMAGGEGGAWIYKFRGLAQGLKLYSHQ